MPVILKTDSIEGVDLGHVAYFARNTAPNGWIKANGASIDRTTYALLFAAIGTTFGSGNGSTTFTLPDLRGEWIRSWDDARGVDSSRSFGSAQGSAVQNHTHTTTNVLQSLFGGDGEYDSNAVSNIVGANDFASRSPTTSNPSGGNAENRVRNIALLACIKAF